MYEFNLHGAAILSPVNSKLWLACLYPTALVCNVTSRWWPVLTHGHRQQLAWWTTTPGVHVSYAAVRAGEAWCCLGSRVTWRVCAASRTIPTCVAGSLAAGHRPPALPAQPLLLSRLC
jgi:hypothetical protein